MSVFEAYGAFNRGIKISDAGFELIQLPLVLEQKGVSEEYWDRSLILDSSERGLGKL